MPYLNDKIYHLNSLFSIGFNLNSNSWNNDIIAQKFVNKQVIFLSEFLFSLRINNIIATGFRL